MKKLTRDKEVIASLERDARDRTQEMRAQRKRDAELELAKRELSRRHLGHFIRYHFHDYRENWHHKEIISKLEAVERGEITRLMIFVPPRHGKSEIASINFPAWYFGRNPQKSIIASSYNGDLAISFGRKARNIVNSAEYKNIFPKVTLAEDSKAAGQWNTNEGGEYTAIGIGGGATGRGADVLLIDDPVKDLQEAISPVIQERNIGWFRAVARTRLAPGGAIVVIQTRWHDQDLSGQILANDPDWTIIDLPAIAEKDEPHRKKDEALWPEQYPLSELLKTKKDLGTELFSALYQQRPLSKESMVFRRDMFRTRTLQEVISLNTRCFVTIDPAPGKTERADNIGVCINFVDEENKWNFIAFKIKFDAAELIKMLFKLDKDYNVEAFGIEKGMYKDVLKPFLDAEMAKRDRFLTIIELDHQHKNKQLRIKGLQPRYEAKGVYHIEDMCADLEDELISFPKSVHDDVSDAAAYQSQIAEPPAKAMHAQNILENRDNNLNATRDMAGLMN